MEKNQKLALNLLRSKINDIKIDIILLPEMCFTGYMFKDKQEIMPFTDNMSDLQNSKTFQWASKTGIIMKMIKLILALEFNAYVIVGFPEFVSEEHLYNSLMVVNNSGRLVTVYKKHFLYETDENWADEGPSFFAMDIEDLNNRVNSQTIQFII